MTPNDMLYALIFAFAGLLVAVVLGYVLGHPWVRCFVFRRCPACGGDQPYVQTCLVCGGRRPRAKQECADAWRRFGGKG